MTFAGYKQIARAYSLRGLRVDVKSKVLTDGWMVDAPRRGLPINFAAAILAKFT